MQCLFLLNQKLGYFKRRTDYYCKNFRCPEKHFMGL